MTETEAEAEAPVERPYTGGAGARAAVIGLVCIVVLDVLDIGLAAATRWSLNNDAHYDQWGDYVPPEWLLGVETFLSITPLVALFFTGVIFLIWFSRAHGYARSKVPTLTGGPVIAWFIPIGNLWLPYQRVRDVWDVITKKPHGLVQVWWGFWIAKGVIGRITMRQPETIDGFLDLQIAVVASDVLDIVAALLAAHIVLQIDSAARNESPTTF